MDKQNANVLKTVVLTAKKTPKPAAKKKSAPRGGVKSESVAAAYSSGLKTYFKVRPGPKKFKDSIIVNGLDYLEDVKMPGATPVPGQVLTEIYLNPTEFGGTRFNQYGKLYEKFLFTDFKVHYIPGVGTAKSGSLILAHDRDIYDNTPPTGLAGVRELLSMEDAVSDSVWKSFSMRCPLEMPDVGYFTSPNGVDDRLAYQGQVYCAVLGVPDATLNTSLGSLAIEYEAVLFVPQNENFVVNNTYSANLSTGFSAADALKPFAGVNAPVVAATNSPDMTISLVNGIATAFLKEGLYWWHNKAVQNQAGAVNVGSPNPVSLAPVPAAAPQPLTKVLSVGTASAVGDSAMQDWLLDIPRGGCSVTQPYTTSTGLTGNPGQSLIVTRLGGYLMQDAFNNMYS